MTRLNPVARVGRDAIRSERAARPAGAADSAGQRALEALLERIRARVAQRAEWDAYLLAYNQRVSCELVPARGQLAALQRALAERVAAILQNPEQARALNAGQRATLRWLALQLNDAACLDRDDACNADDGTQWSDSDGPGRQDHQQDPYGTDADEKPPEPGKAQAGSRGTHDKGERQDTRRADQKTKKLAREQARRALRAADAGATLRALYRKLALALHPDRERDSGVQAWKTDLLQRVNAAYRDRDLFTLLAIQFEASQYLSATQPIAADTRTHYIDLLEERLAALNAEIANRTAPFRAAIGCDSGYALTPAIVDRYLSSERARLETACAALEEDLEAFGTLAGLRGWLRRHMQGDRPSSERASLRESQASAAMGWPEQTDRRPRRRRRA